MEKSKALKTKFILIDIIFDYTEYWWQNVYGANDTISWTKSTLTSSSCSFIMKLTKLAT